MLENIYELQQVYEIILKYLISAKFPRAEIKMF